VSRLGRRQRILALQRFMAEKAGDIVLLVGCLLLLGVAGFLAFLLARLVAMFR